MSVWPCKSQCWVLGDQCYACDGQVTSKETNNYGIEDDELRIPEGETDDVTSFG